MIKDSRIFCGGPGICVLHSFSLNTAAVPREDVAVLHLVDLTFRFQKLN